MMSILRSQIVLLLIVLSGYSSAHVSLNNPTGGETYNSGDTVTIEWEIAISHTIQNWDLFFSSDGGASWDTIQVDITPVGSSAGTIQTYEWIVPPMPTNQAQIWIYMDNSGTDYEDISGDFTITGTTGVKEIGSRAFKIYPNPVRSYVSMDLSALPEVLELRITNINGSTVNSIYPQGNSIIRINSANFTTGMYMVLAICANGVVYREKLLIHE